MNSSILIHCGFVYLTALSLCCVGKYATSSTCVSAVKVFDKSTVFVFKKFDQRPKTGHFMKLLPVLRYPKRRRICFFETAAARACDEAEAVKILPEISKLLSEVLMQSLRRKPLGDQKTQKGNTNKTQPKVFLHNPKRNS